MGVSEQSTPNRFVHYARKIYHPLGFQKGYNFILFVIFGGGFFAFCASRTPYMNINGVFCKQRTRPPGVNDILPGAAPGECYYYNYDHIEKIGIRLHLYCVIPAGMLAVLQFIPVIRYKALIFHRINGYITIILGILGAIGGMMIAKTALGGTVDTQAGTGVAFILTVGSLFMGYINIKRLQFEQHRAWMLRAWAYFAIILTVRLTLKALARIMTNMGDWWGVWPCERVQHALFDNPAFVKVLYPACASFLNGTDIHAVTAVKANSDVLDPVQIGAALGLGFGTTIWIAIFLHAVGIEIYLHLTPREANRLRQISYQRQLEAGYKNPGNGGLTVQRFGDADPFIPASAAITHKQSDTTSDSACDEITEEIKPSQLARPEAKSVDSSSSSE